MPRVDAKHPDYDRMETQWSKIRDSIEGEDAIKGKGTTYLPKLFGQTEAHYQAYKGRATFFAAAQRTVQALAGAVMRRDPDLSGIPEPIEDQFESLGRSGETLTELINTALEEVIGMGRIGFLVDSADDSDVPYVTWYRAEDILNWQTAVIDGRRKLTLVVLSEARIEQDDSDPFIQKEIEKFRVLQLMHGSDVGDDSITSSESEMLLYSQELWSRKKNEARGGESSFVMEDRFIPRKKGGGTFDEIPFVFINSGDTKPDVSKPLLIDLVNLNLSHYHNSADLEHGRHFTALPTPWAAGFQPPQGQNTLPIGSMEAWISDNPDARAGYLEFTGNGLGHLQEGMDKKEKMMAVLGARILEEQSPGVEAADTVRLRQAGEKSALTRIAITVSEGLQRVLRLVGQWFLVEDSLLDDLQLELNRDFNPSSIEPQMLVQLVGMVQSGLISWSTFIFNLRRGEVLPPGISEDEEAERIRAGGPGLDPVSDLLSIQSRVSSEE